MRHRPPSGVWGGPLPFAGGWEWWGGANRYIAIAMPAFFVAFVCVVTRVSAALAELIPNTSRAQENRETEPQRREGQEGASTDEPFAALAPSRYRSLLSARWGLVALAFVSFSSFQPGPEGRQTPADWLLLNPPLHVAGNRDTATIARLVRQVTTPEARVGVVWAGAIPYFSERPCVDLLGKNDRVIAHLPMRLSQKESRSTDFYPGHLKWD